MSSKITHPLVSRIFRAGSKIKNRALLYKGFRKPKSGARINKDTNTHSGKGRVIVIGAGIGGLTTEALLARLVA